VDHRYTPVVKQNLLLEPTWDQESIPILQKVLPIYYPLDLTTDFNTRSIQYYNRIKYRKRHRAASKQEQTEIPLIEPKMDFFPRFQQYKFIEDWKRKQAASDQELLIGLGDKNKIKINPSGNPSIVLY
jgi:hypothetical protein